MNWRGLVREFLSLKNSGQKVRKHIPVDLARPLQQPTSTRLTFQTRRSVAEPGTIVHMSLECPRLGSLDAGPVTIMTCEGKLVSIVAPFYNEGEVVESFYQALCGVLDSLPDPRFEVICVDDGSRDDTLQRLISLTDRDERFSVIELSRNFGKEAALTAGLDAAQGDAVIPIDADLQDPPELIPALIAAWQKGADVVLAEREDRDSDTFLKRSTAMLFYRLHNWLSKVQIPANVGDFRLMDKSVLEALRQLPERQRFMKGLFAWVGFNTATVRYSRDPRNVGSTKYSWWSLLNHALEGLTSFSTEPLRLCAYAGGLTAVLTLFYASYILMRTLIRGVDLPGYASLLVAVLFLGSLQLIAIGVLGEYVGRIYMETKQRPMYLIRRLHKHTHKH
jgi:glycosyltransferase involved in cell wall biosynthesis